MQAFEDRPLHQIERIAVGMLIHVKPPCEVRRGILMLTDKNTELVYLPKEQVVSKV